jgi:hypothetical protein
MGTRSLPAVDRTDTPQPWCGECGRPQDRSPTKPYSHLARESAPMTLGRAVLGGAAAGYSTADPLPLRTRIKMSVPAS